MICYKINIQIKVMDERDRQLLKAGRDATHQQRYLHHRNAVSSSSARRGRALPLAQPRLPVALGRPGHLQCGHAGLWAGVSAAGALADALACAGGHCGCATIAALSLSELAR